MDLSNYKKHIYWLLPSIIYLLSSFFSVINVDGVRDYLEAYAIASGSDFTLVGPQMAFSFHVAPLWYYFLSILFIFSKSWFVLSVFVTFLAVFKFYYAFKLGRVLLGQQYAILLIASMMLASFTIIQQITFTHTNLIEVSVLYIIYFCLTSDMNSSKNWFFLGFLVAIALHIHPTTAVVTYWIVPKLFQSKSILKNIGSSCIGFLIPFLPIIVHEFASDFENIKGVIGYLSSKTNTHDFLGFFKLAQGTIFTTVYNIYEMLFPPLIAKFLFVVHSIFLATIIILALWSIQFQSNKTKRLFYNFLGFWLFSIVFVVLIRTNTPWYMTYSVTLSFNLLFALCLWVVTKRFSWKLLPNSVFFLTTLILILIFTSLAQKLRDNSLYLHGVSWNDIQSLSTEQFTTTGFEIPAYQSDEHAQYLCQYESISLHGPYATLIHSHSGIEILSKCPNNQILYGNAENTYKIFALPGILAKHVKLELIKKIGDAYFYPVKSISKQQNITEEDFISEYKRKYHKEKEWSKKDISVLLSNGKHLIISKLYGSFSNIVIKEVKVNGTIVKPVENTNYATLYVCSKCQDDNSNWKIVFSESDSGSTSIVSF